MRLMPPLTRSTLIGCLLAVAVPFSWGGLVEWRAQAHEAAAGWSYPIECCSGHDCYEIEATDVVAVPGGWRIKATGEVKTTAETRFSPDGRYHRCSYAADRLKPTICLFVPAMGT